METDPLLGFMCDDRVFKRGAGTDIQDAKVSQRVERVRSRTQSKKWDVPHASFVTTSKTSNTLKKLVATSDKRDLQQTVTHRD